MPSCTLKFIIYIYFRSNFYDPLLIAWKLVWPLTNNQNFLTTPFFCPTSSPSPTPRMNAPLQTEKTFGEQTEMRLMYRSRNGHPLWLAARWTMFMFKRRSSTHSYTCVEDLWFKIGLIKRWFADHCIYSRNHYKVMHVSMSINDRLLNRLPRWLLNPIMNTVNVVIKRHWFKSCIGMIDKCMLWGRPAAAMMQSALCRASNFELTKNSSKLEN